MNSAFSSFREIKKQLSLRIMAIVLISFSCTNQNKSLGGLELTTWYDSIEIGYDQLAFYYKYDIEILNDELIVAAQNHTDFSLDIFNQDAFIKKIPLENEGPDAIVGSNSLGNTFIQNGRLFIPDRFSSFKFLDIESLRLEHLYDFNPNHLGEYQVNKSMNMTQFDRASLSLDGKYVAFHIFHPDIINYKTDNLYSEKYFNTAVFDLDKDSILFYHIPYPNTHSSNNLSFGELDYPSYVFLSDYELLVAFQNCPEMCVLDIRTGKVQKSDVNKTKGLPLSKSLTFSEVNNRDQRMNHYFMEPKYHQIFYHHEKKWIYRVYKDKTDTKTVFDYSQNYLLVFDTNFNILFNDKINESIHPLLFPTKNGLVGLVKDISSERYLKLAYLSLVN